MDMIKKIAITASTMLFVLAQIFSFYMIYISHQKKIELLIQKEQKIVEDGISDFENERNKINYRNSLKEYILTYCFRHNMPENSALYQGNEELFNNSPYEFEVDKIKIEPDLQIRNISYKKEQLNEEYLILFLGEFEIEQQKYTICHILNITYVYEESRNLLIREMMISILLSATMAVALVFLIKKITKPLEAANEAQRQLIGSMSHELKTPLTAIKGYSETLLNVKLSEEQMQKSLKYINTESGRLSRLSEKMMELTKLYEPDCKIELHQILVEELFQDVENNVIHKLEEKGMTLVREGNYQGIKKNMDKDLMTSFLINLINNSIMASKPESRIFMGADKEAIWVRDEGCGIPPKEVDKVCKAFYRVDKSRARKSGNMGLGLALCEQIAKVHQTTMKIESEVGKGTKISINIAS